MGRSIYLAESELSAIRDTIGEWCCMMSDGDENSCKEVDDRLEDGLGSALKKLYKGLNGEEVYKDY